MKKIYRILELKYSNDMLSKKKKFDEELKKYKNDLKIRNVKIKKYIINSRSNLFQIKLFGYDSSLKFLSNKYNSLPKIINLIDNMPMGKIEKKKSIELFTNAHPKSTIHGLGFKNKNTAIQSLKKIKNKPIKYQKQVATTMFYRAKYHPHQTKNMKDAMKIYEKFLKKIKKLKGGSHVKFPYLDLKIINKFEKLADYYNVSRKARGLEKPSTSDEGFLVVYKKIKNPKKLKDIPCRKNKPDGVNWERKREIEVSGKLGQSKKMKIPLFHKDGPLKGLPTIIHINMIMWAYSPEPDKLKKSIKLLNTFFKIK